MTHTDVPDASPLVSIVTPSFNQAPFIRDTIESVLSQNHPSIEYIVIDGGSTDGTVEILKDYGRRLTWVSERDGGQSQAINKGWSICRGSILAYLNSDDTYCPGAVGAAVQALARHPDVDMVYGDCRFIDADGATLKLMPGRQMGFDDILYWRSHLSQPTVFLRKSVLDRIGLINESLHYAMDFDYWLRIAYECRIAYIPVCLANERHYPASKTVSAPELGLQGRIQSLEQFFSLNRHPSVSRLRASALATQYVKLARYYLGQGEFTSAQRHALRGAMLRPPIPLLGMNALILLLGLIPIPAFGKALRKTFFHWGGGSNTYPYIV